MRKLILCATLALLATDIAFGQCPLAFEGADQALIGVYIAPVSNGSRPLVEYNSEKLLTPASVMKAVTTAAALTHCGGDYRWKTTVAASGKIADGILHGNIIITGSGDPTLGSAQFRKEQPDFLQTVKEVAALRGICRIEGKTVKGGAAWPDLGPVPSWELEDIPGPDGAGFYPLNYMDNVFILSVPSMRTVPQIPGLSVKQMGGNSGLYASRFPGSTQLRVYGRLGHKQKRASLKCSMPDPSAVLLTEVDSIFAAGGKNFDACADTVMLTQYMSPALRDVTRSLMVRSDNQMAEATLRLLAPNRSRKEALAKERAILSDIGVNLKNARLADGSGLSRHNAISPRQLGSVLRAMAANGDYIGSYARVGLDGTVRSFMKGMNGADNFVLKSGSMTGVVCYAGYRLDPETKEPTHVIVMMVNNAPNASAARKAMAELLASKF